MRVDVLAIGAHPDDVEIGIGGLVRKLVDQGYQVGILDLTRGELGTRGSVEERRVEARQAGEILGVVGESGCGKSTLARLILRLLKPSDGQIWFEGTDIALMRRRDLRKMRRRFQMVFQDPYSSIDPRQTMREALLEPFQVQGIELGAKQARDTVAELLEMVTINPDMADTYAQIGRAHV